jgi:IS30 family transposase
MSGCYSQLTLADRRLLHRLVDQKVTINEMARRLGRHRSTIYREIRRNTFHDRELPQYTGYFGTIADQLTRERRRRLRKLRRHPDLRADVIRQLKARWSPEQIAGRLLSEGISPVRVSAETIYRFIYSKEDYALGLYQYLPEARRKRRPLRSRNRAMVLFQQAIVSAKGLISLETDRSLVIGRATSSYSSVRLAMPMSHHSLSAKAAIPF